MLGKVVGHRSFVPKSFFAAKFSLERFYLAGVIGFFHHAASMLLGVVGEGHRMIGGHMILENVFSFECKETYFTAVHAAIDPI